VGLAASMSSVLAMAPVWADDFPTKPVTIVVPWQAGTVPDVALRILAEMAKDDMGQPIVVTNVEGGGGTKGMNFVKNQPADGYTIINDWVAPQTVAKIMNPDVGYSDEDFAPIGGFIFSPFMLMVAANHPAHTLPEFVDWAKGQDRQLNVGVCAALSVPRMVMEEFLAVAAIENYNPVPYQGCSADNHKGVLDGSLDFTTADMAGVNTFGDAVKVLAIFTDERVASVPDIPTAKEQGFDLGWEGKSSRGWGGLAVRAGTPEDRRQHLIDVLGKWLQSDAFTGRMLAERKLPIECMPPEQFEALWYSSQDALRPTVERIIAKEGKG
jgi:tripartite-type tricarboxylate transporter receptor subunit TctC